MPKYSRAGAARPDSEPPFAKWDSVVEWYENHSVFAFERIKAGCVKNKGLRTRARLYILIRLGCPPADEPLHASWYIPQAFVRCSVEKLTKRWRELFGRGVPCATTVRRNLDWLELHCLIVRRPGEPLYPRGVDGDPIKRPRHARTFYPIFCDEEVLYCQDSDVAAFLADESNLQSSRNWPGPFGEGWREEAQRRHGAPRVRDRAIHAASRRGHPALTVVGRDERYTAFVHEHLGSGYVIPKKYPGEVMRFLGGESREAREAADVFRDALRSSPAFDPFTELISAHRAAGAQDPLGLLLVQGGAVSDAHRELNLAMFLLAYREAGEPFHRLLKDAGPWRPWNPLPLRRPAHEETMQALFGADTVGAISPDSRWLLRVLLATITDPDHFVIARALLRLGGPQCVSTALLRLEEEMRGVAGYSSTAWDELHRVSSSALQATGHVLDSIGDHRLVA